ncbi:hypothetical protein [Roseovarius sp. D0-M9]|uniref:hypothetical protein n=1 Tax=Roseovarius sp. D0-M9 TaxID=3127117 RepID=UPI0030103B46
MSIYLKAWLEDECGAVTVDWVVLTAAVVALGVTAVASARTGIEGLSGKIETDVAAIETGTE